MSKEAEADAEEATGDALDDFVQAEECYNGCEHAWMEHEVQAKAPPQAVPESSVFLLHLLPFHPVIARHCCSLRRLRKLASITAGA